MWFYKWLNYLIIDRDKICFSAPPALTGRRQPDALGRRQLQAESTWRANAAIEILEVRKHRFDRVADAVIVGCEFGPWHFGASEARQQKSLVPDQQVGAIELGRDVHGKR